VTENLKDRKKLSFAQAEGAAPLPSQLRPREVTSKLRAVLWAVVYERLRNNRMQGLEGAYFDDAWSNMLRDEFIFQQHGMMDDFDNDADGLIEEVRDIFEDGDYLRIFGWLEFILKHSDCPPNFHEEVQEALVYCRAAYRVVDKVIICPIASDAEHKTIVQAFADLGAQQLNGARAHLKNAASHLTSGKFADSVRESIHAVESVCRTLDPSADLAKALARLEQKIAIHPSMKQGFKSLYNYTSDERGVRHALHEGGEAKVDEADALFMIGACAAFVSYLLNKARTNGLL
jgi:hypothetical protein